MEKLVYLVLCILLLFIEIVPFTHYVTKIIFKKNMKESFIILFILLILIKLIYSAREELINDNINYDFFYKYIVFFMLSVIIINFYLYYNDLQLGFIYSLLLFSIIVIILKDYNNHYFSLTLLLFYGLIFMRFYELFKKKDVFVVGSVFLTLLFSYNYINFFIDSIYYYKKNKIN